MSDEATPNGKAQLLLNGGIERLPFTKDFVINLVLTTFKIATVKVVKRFINFSFSAISLTFA